MKIIFMFYSKKPTKIQFVKYIIHVTFQNKIKIYSLEQLEIYIKRFLFCDKINDRGNTIVDRGCIVYSQWPDWTTFCLKFRFCIVIQTFRYTPFLDVWKYQYDAMVIVWFEFEMCKLIWSLSILLLRGWKSRRK